MRGASVVIDGSRDMNSGMNLVGNWWEESHDEVVVSTHI